MVGWFCLELKWNQAAQVHDGRQEGRCPASPQPLQPAQLRNPAKRQAAPAAAPDPPLLCLVTCDVHLWSSGRRHTASHQHLTTTLQIYAMASDEPPNPMAESGVTIRSDSEQYSGHEELSASPPSSSSPAVILYQPPTIWSIFRGAAINLFLPFINGMMLGFGELFAHEAAFRLGWSNTRVRHGRCRSRTFMSGVQSLIHIRSSPSRGGKRIPSALVSRWWRSRDGGTNSMT